MFPQCSSSWRGLPGSRGPSIPVHTGLQDFSGCSTFSAETRTVLGKPGQLITLPGSLSTEEHTLFWQRDMPGLSVSFQGNEPCISYFSFLFFSIFHNYRLYRKVASVVQRIPRYPPPRPSSFHILLHLLYPFSLSLSLKSKL